MLKFSLNCDNNYSYDCYDDNVFLGKCIFTIESRFVYINSLYVSSYDNLIAEGLIRSCLNFAAGRLAYISVFNSADYKNVALALGYSIDNNGLLSGEIPELLKGNCGKKDR